MYMSDNRASTSTLLVDIDMYMQYYYMLCFLTIQHLMRFCLRTLYIAFLRAVVRWMCVWCQPLATTMPTQSPSLYLQLVIQLKVINTTALSSCDYITHFSSKHIHYFNSTTLLQRMWTLLQHAAA